MKKVLINYCIDGAVETQKVSEHSTEYNRRFKFIGSIYLIDGDSVEYVHTLSFIGVYHDVPEKIQEIMYMYNGMRQDEYQVIDTCISFNVDDVQVMKEIVKSKQVLKQPDVCT